MEQYAIMAQDCKASATPPSPIGNFSQEIHEAEGGARRIRQTNGPVKPA